MSDLESRLFVVRQGRLIPADIWADEFVAGIGEGKQVLVTIRRPRNPKHHKLVFAIIKKVLDNTDLWGGDVDNCLEDLKMATGLVTRRVNLITSEPYIKAKSISWAAMSQDPFNEWFGRAVHIIATQVLDVEETALFAEIMDMVEGQWRSGHNRRHAP